MKRFLFVTAVLLAAAAGCDREPCAECSEDPVPRHVTLTLDGCGPATRSADISPEAEGRVSRCQLYVFSRGGSLVGSYPSPDGIFELYLTDETYDFVAVANKEVLPSAPPTKESLLSTVTTLSENDTSRFVMVGKLENHLIMADEKITVEVSRLVAKVTCCVRTAFTGILAERPFEVEDIYLTNVAGENDLALSHSVPDASGTWYNRLDLAQTGNAGHPAEFLHEKIGRQMAASDSLGDGLCLYAYPNASADSHDKDRWGSRCTRFVVRATLAGKRFFYPVTLEEVRPNRHYHIELTIAGYGFDHPEDQVSPYGSLAASVTVFPWIEGGDFIGDF